MTLVEGHTEAVEGYLRTPPPAPSVLWRGASFAVLGLGEPGPDPHQDEIVSVACVPVEGGRAIIGKASETLVHPGRIDEALDAILEALTGRVLVAHGAAVHAGFLSAALKRTGIGLRGPTLDTAVLAGWVPRRAAPNGDPFAARDAPSGLSRAATGMGLPVHHPDQASGEALTAAQLFMALASHLDRVHPQSVSSLARLAPRTRRSATSWANLGPRDARCNRGWR